MFDQRWRTRCTTAPLKICPNQNMCVIHTRGIRIRFQPHAMMCNFSRGQSAFFPFSLSSSRKSRRWFCRVVFLLHFIWAEIAISTRRLMSFRQPLWLHVLRRTSSHCGLCFLMFLYLMLRTRLVWRQWRHLCGGRLSKLKKTLINCVFRLIIYLKTIVNYYYYVAEVPRLDRFFQLLAKSSLLLQHHVYTPKGGRQSWSNVIFTFRGHLDSFKSNK